VSDKVAFITGASRGIGAESAVALARAGYRVVITARTLVEKEPNYTYATARLLLDSLRSEALGFLGVASAATAEQMNQLYPQALAAYVARGVELELLDPRLAEFDLDVIGRALDGQRDLQFTYLGLQTLYDRYFIHTEDIRFELPQCFFMRVAMGLAINEVDREGRAELDRGRAREDEADGAPHAAIART